MFFYCLNFAHKIFTWNVEEESHERRERNPELNTKNFDIHKRRLDQLSKSKDKNHMFYISADSNLLLLFRDWKGMFLKVY